MILIDITEWKANLMYKSSMLYARKPVEVGSKFNEVQCAEHTVKVDR